MVDISMAPGPAVPGSGGPGLQHMLGSMLGPVVAQLQVAAAAHGAGRGGAAAAGRGNAAQGGRGAGRGPGRGAAAGRGAAGERRGQPEQGEQVVRVRLLDGAGQPVPAAVPVGGAAGQAAAAAGGEMSEEVAGMAAMLLGQLGVDPAGQQQLLGQFGGIMRALRETSGACLLGGRGGGLICPCLRCLVLLHGSDRGRARPPSLASPCLPCCPFPRLGCLALLLPPSFTTATLPEPAPSPHR
jgi:hypothetical protein